MKKKAIIVTHPNKGWKTVLFGLDYDKLCLLAEFRYSIKKTIKKRFKTIDYDTDLDLSIKTKGIDKYKIDYKMYKQEIQLYFKLR